VIPYLSTNFESYIHPHWIINYGVTFIGSA